MPIFRPWRHGSRAGYGSGVAGVDRRPKGNAPRSEASALGAALAVASSIPATQLSSPARLAERVVTPHAPMTLGANHVSRRQKGHDPAAAGDLRLGHRAPGRGGRRASIHSSPRADNTSVRAGGVLSVRIPRFSTNLNILRLICSVHGYPTQRVASTSRPRSERFWLLELRASGTGTKPPRSGNVTVTR